MIRSGFQSRKLPEWPKPDRSAEFASVVIAKPVAVMATADSIAARTAQPAPAPKLPREARTDNGIRQAARGEHCTVRLHGVCNGDRATSVWSHWPGLDADRGMGIKAVDLCGAVACSACHDAIDGRAPLPANMPREKAMMDWMLGHMRSLVLLVRKGVI